MASKKQDTNEAVRDLAEADARAASQQPDGPAASEPEAQNGPTTDVTPHTGDNELLDTSADPVAPVFAPPPGPTPNDPPANSAEDARTAQEEREASGREIRELRETVVEANRDLKARVKHSLTENTRTQEAKHLIIDARDKSADPPATQDLAGLRPAVAQAVEDARSIVNLDNTDNLRDAGRLEQDALNLVNQAIAKLDVRNTGFQTNEKVRQAQRALQIGKELLATAPADNLPPAPGE